MHSVITSSRVNHTVSQAPGWQAQECRINNKQIDEIVQHTHKIHGTWIQ